MNPKSLFFAAFCSLPRLVQMVLILSLVTLLIIAGCVPGAVTPMLALLLALNGVLSHERR